MSDWIAVGLCWSSGGFFCLVAGVGVVRLRDIYARMHASTKAGTLGLCARSASRRWSRPRPGATCSSALFVFLFMIATAPVGAHLIGRAAFRSRIPEAPGTAHDPDCDAFRGADRR